MALRYVMVSLPDSDTHDVIPSGDTLVNAAGTKYILQGQPDGLIASYATLAAAIADTANLFDGQYVVIAGGQDVGAKPNDDRGIWKVVSNNGAARSDYTKNLDITNKAVELYVDDAGGFFTGTDAEAVLQEIGTKQVFYKLGGLASATVRGTSSVALDAAISALVIDKGTATDPDGVGSATVPGVLLNNIYAYQIPLRNASTRDVIDDGFGNEVYGRLTQVGGDYVVSFYSYKAGVETAYSFTGVAATGNIALSDQPNDGDTVVIADGVHPAITFEFDDDASVVETATLRQVVIGVDTAATVAALIAAITASDSTVAASAGAGTSVNLSNPVGLAGNIALTGVDTAVVQTLTGMTGGTGVAIEAAYVLVSQDFMNLPAYAGVVQGEFWGDQAGAVGTVADTQVTTAGPFDGLLTGQTTQAGVNAKVDELGETVTGKGASLVKVEDAAGNFASDNVEGVLLELSTSIAGKIKNYANLAAAYVAAPHAIGTYLIITGAGGDAAERGVYKVTSGTGSAIGEVTKVLDISHTAAEVLIADAGGKFTGTSVETALDELIAAIGGASTAVRDYSSNVFVSDNDPIVTAIGKLDAALATFSSDQLSSLAFSANESIAALTNGPRLVSQDGVAWRVVLSVAAEIGAKVETVGFATGADYVLNGAINQGKGVVLSGLLGGFTGLVPGSTYYADPAAAGGITATLPSTIGDWIIPVGVAVSTSSLLVRIGEPQQITAALPSLQRAVHFKSTSGGAGGLGETGYTVAVGDLWIDNDDTVQNPTKNGTDRFTLYVCKAAWTGAGSALTAGNLSTYFSAVGKQN